MISSKLRTLLRLAQCLRPYPWHTLLALVTFAAAGATVIALGQGVRRLLDFGLHGTASALNFATLVLFALATVYGASALARAYLSGFIAERVTADLRRSLMRRLLDHGPAYFEQQGSGHLWSRIITDLGVIASMLSALVAAARSCVVLVGGLWAMLTTSGSFTLITIALGMVIIGVIVWTGRKIKSLSDEAQELTSRSNTFALEAIDGLRIVKAFAQENHWADRFAGLAEAAFRKADRRNFIHGATIGLSIWMIFGSAIFLAWVIGHEMIRGEISEGRASAFLFYAVVVAMSGGALIDLWGQLQKGVGGAERLFFLLDQEPAICSPEAPRRVSNPARGEISFSTVSFRYPLRQSPPALEDISAKFQPGTLTAIVGPSGAGKSTLFQLLLRLYDPTTGAICIDDVDLRSMDIGELRELISIVPQEPTLFEGTVQDNIRFGRATATGREIVAAAEAANAMNFIEDLPRGLSTEVGPRGTQLSGGQRQRIAIARAIIKNPRILLLDEATNALDASSEAAIQAAINALIPGRTTLVIAHKLATVRAANRILVIDRGKLTSDGNHKTLVAEDGVYSRFAALQLL